MADLRNNRIVSSVLLNSIHIHLITTSLRYTHEKQGHSDLDIKNIYT